MKIAHNMPKVIDGLQDQVKDFKHTLRVGAAVLTICPILALVAWIDENAEYEKEGEQKAWTDILY